MKKNRNSMTHPFTGRLNRGLSDERREHHSCDLKRMGVSLSGTGFTDGEADVTKQKFLGLNAGERSALSRFMESL